MTEHAGITELEDGRLRVRATAKNPKTNKIEERQRTLSADQTITDALSVRDRLKRKIQGISEAEKRNVVFVADYAAKWLNRKTKTTKPRTAREYKRVIEEKVIPQIGGIRLTSFAREDVLDWLEWAQAQTNSDGKPMAKSTIKGWWRVLRAMLRDASADQYLSHHYTERVPNIQTGRRDVRSYETLTLREIRDLIDAAGEHCPKRYAEIVTLTLTGMRSGELWALRWQDVDRERDLLLINRSVSDGEIVESPKTGAERKVPMSPMVARAIQSHRWRQLANQPRGWRMTDLIFPSDQGTPRLPGSLRKAFKKSTAKAGIDKKVTPQVLRKTYTTTLESAGVRDLVRREIMGHSGEGIDRHYKQAPTAEKRQAAEEVERVVFR